MADIPGDLKFPLRVVNGDFAVHEQDSLEEITQCVASILRTPRGWRDLHPDLGVGGVLFRRGGVDTAEIERQIATYEPRVDTVVKEDPSMLQQALSNVGVRLQ